jgi:hypothetical protein
LGDSGRRLFFDGFSDGDSEKAIERFFNDREGWLADEDQAGQADEKDGHYDLGFIIGIFNLDEGH